MTTAKDREPVLASIVRTDGGNEEYWWNGEPGRRGGVVFKTDRFGQRWTLDIRSTHWVTQRVAAGLLEVSVMTISNWIREGKITDTKKRNGVAVISLKEVERIAEARGMFVRKALTPEQRRSIRAASFNRKKGGDKNANES
jgi:hypothetical protein